MTGATGSGGESTGQYRRIYASRPETRNAGRNVRKRRPSPIVVITREGYRRVYAK